MADSLEATGSTEAGSAKKDHRWRRIAGAPVDHPRRYSPGWVDLLGVLLITALVMLLGPLIFGDLTTLPDWALSK